ncbi:unnamed protein product [Sphagnum jensenii]|uniref:Fe-S hydro-lyase tartrate dehydratase alpha-type catalytic domain-containing protein n=1 Tax=Sphagnum jensenii TaxID=128206 RepID=A0ABP0VHD8_9BRYO
MPVSDSVAGYALLTVAGIWYTVGSYIFINCFRNDYAEQKAKSVNILHSSSIFCRNDELIGIWCFLIGSLPFIPLMVIYVYYNPTSSSFQLALALVVFGIVGLFVYILAVAPEREDTCLVRLLKVLDPCLQIIRKKHSEDVEIRILTPCVEPLFCCFKRHVCTDWLIGSWIITIGCFLGVVGAICVMIYYIVHFDPRSVYDYATGAFDYYSFSLGVCTSPQLSNILKDPEATENDKFVALELLKNANIASHFILPGCQDTGTAIVIGKRGQYVLTDGDDEKHISHGVYDTYTQTSLRYSQVAPLDMYAEANTNTNLPAQIDLFATKGSEYEFLFIGDTNTILTQR